MEHQLDESKIGQSYHTGEDVAANLPIRPVPDGKDAYKVVVFGLTEGFLNHVAIQTGSNDLIGRPLSLVGDENVFPKLLNVETDPVVVLPGEEPPLSLILLKGDLVEIFREMELLACFRVVPLNSIGISPVGFLSLYLLFEIEDALVKARELLIEGVSLFGSGSGIVGHNSRSLLFPELSPGAPGNEPVIFLAKPCELTIPHGIDGFKFRELYTQEILSEIGGVGGDEVDLGSGVDKSNVLLGVHALIKDQGQFAILSARLSHGADHLGEDLLKLLGIVAVSFIFPVEEGKLSIPGNQKRHADLSQPVLAFLVLSPLCKLRLGVARHVGIVVCGIEKKAICAGLLDFYDLFEEKRCNLANVSFADPIPLLPVSLGGELAYVNGSNLLNGGGSEPFRESSLGAGIDHSVEDSVKEVLPNGWSLLLFRPGDNRINEGGEPCTLLHEVSKKERSEFLNGDFAALVPATLCQFDDALNAAEIDLIDHLRLAIHPGDFADVVVGSSLFHLLVHVRHEKKDIVGSYLSQAKYVQHTNFS